MRVVRTVMVTAGLCLAACNEPVYLQETRPLDATNMEMQAEGSPTLFSDSDLFVLPVRKPTGKEAQALKDEQQKLGLPMPVPWAGERDFDIEIQWSMKNLDTQMISSRVTLNGGNEFGDYVKSLYMSAAVDTDEQATPPELLGSDQLVPMEAGAVISGIFREDDLREAGIDLEVITRYPPPDAGMNAPFIAIEHNSTASSVGLENIPKGDITPAMVRYLITLESTGHAALDYVIRVREKGTPSNKLDVGGKNLYVSTASIVMPPVLPTADPTTAD